MEVTRNDILEFCAGLLRQCKNNTGQQNHSNTSCLRKLFENGCLDLRPPSSDQAQQEDQLQLSLVVTFIIIAVFSLFSNVFVCLVFYLSKEIRHAKNYFIVNLAVADILIAAVAIPFFLAQSIDKTRMTLCQIGSVIDVLCCTSSIIDLAVISLERFVAVRYPLRYKTIVSRRRCLCVIVFVWLYSVAFSLSSYIPIGRFYLNSCVFFTESYVVTVAITSFVLPLLVMLVTYGWIFKVAKSHARCIVRNLPTSGVNRTVRRELKTAKTLTLIIGAYIICWFPFFAYIAVPVLFGYHNYSLALFHTVQIIRYFNSLANPFIYVGINREFRSKALKLLKKWIYLRNNSNMEPSQSRNPSVTADTAVKNISQVSLSIENIRNNNIQNNIPL